MGFIKFLAVCVACIAMGLAIGLCFGHVYGEASVFVDKTASAFANPNFWK